MQYESPRDRQERAALNTAYMTAFEESAAHTDQCLDCQTDQICVTGLPIHQRFADVQDTYHRLYGTP